MRSHLFLVFFLLIFIDLSAQPGRIPPVSVEDFSPVSALITPETDAVILLDSGATILDANTDDGFFTTVYHFRRILIKNKRGLEAGKLSVGFSARLNGGKRLSTLTASTYNLENGKIRKVSLPDKDFFVDETKADYRHEKFAFPDAIEGSILEYEYAVKRYSILLQDWYFQGDYPRLKSVYTVQIPELFDFSISFQNKIYRKGTQSSTFVKNLYTRDFGRENCPIHILSWTYENVPPMPKLAFTSTIDNYLASVKFQLSAEPSRSGATVSVLRDWSWVSGGLLNDENFGLPLNDPGSLVKKETKILTEGKDSEIGKARAIYAFVRDRCKTTGHGVFLTDNRTLSDVFKTGSGNVGEINLLLIAMLRVEKIKADPVILATRSNGLTNPSYPILDNYNYLICRTEIGGKEWFLDASSYMGFGIIPYECYNGHARVITTENFPVYLAPDSLQEHDSTLAEIRNDNTTQKWLLHWTKQQGYYASADTRDELKNATPESVIKTATETVPFHQSPDSLSIDNLQNPDEPLKLHCRMVLDPGNDELIYFNPLLNSGIKENPFKPAVREYPIEMPFRPDEKFILKMDIPAGYSIEELPKSEKIQLNESDGYYDYKVETTGNRIEIRTSLVLNRAIFDLEDYDKLKNFYTAVIKKQNEMIVFKKKK